MNQDAEVKPRCVAVSVEEVWVGDEVATSSGIMEVARVDELPRSRRFALYVIGTPLFDPWRVDDSETLQVTKWRSSRVLVRDRKRWVVTVWRPLDEDGRYAATHTGAQEIAAECLHYARDEAIAAAQAEVDGCPGCWVEVHAAIARPEGDHERLQVAPMVFGASPPDW